MTEEKLRYLSDSEDSTTRDCRARGLVEYHYRLRPTVRSEMFRLGTLTHAGLAARFRANAQKRGIPLAPEERRDAATGAKWTVAGETSVEGAVFAACQREKWAEGKRSTEEDAELAIALTGRIARALSIDEGRFKPALLNGFAAIECKLIAPIPEAFPYARRYYTGGLIGVLDFLGNDEQRDGRSLILDLKVKTRGGLPATDDLGPDPQLMCYQYLAELHGFRPDFAYQFRVRGAVPVEPPLVGQGKKRKLSEAKKVMTDVETFLAACKRHGFNPADYADYLDFLRKRRFWQAAAGGVSKAEVAHAIGHLFANANIAAEMYLKLDPSEWPGGVHPATPNRRTFTGSGCDRCPWNQPCATNYARDFVGACRDMLESGESLEILEEDLDEEEEDNE